MSLQYKLIPNLLSYDEDDYIGVIVQNDLPKFIADLENPLELFGITVKDSQITTTDDTKAIDSLIKDGQCLFTPIVNMRFGIKGNFKGEHDEFDETRHKKIAYLTVGRSFMKKMAQKTKK